MLSGTSTSSLRHESKADTGYKAVVQSRMASRSEHSCKLRFTSAIENDTERNNDTERRNSQRRRARCKDEETILLYGLNTFHEVRGNHLPSEEITK